MKRMWLATLALLFTPSSALASFSFSLSSTGPITISNNTQEVQINLSITDLPSSSYFRVAFQKQSGDSYFGQIKNHLGDWVNVQPFNADCSNYYSVSDTSATSAAILIRVGESSTAQAGEYQLKAHRFTQTACSYAEAQNSLSATVVISTPVSTVVPSLSPSSTSKPPTSTPKPSPTTVVTATLKPTFAPTTTTKPISNPTPETVLATTDFFSPPPFSQLSSTSLSVPTPPPSDTDSVLNKWPAIGLVSLGLIGLGFSFLLLSRPLPRIP